MKNIRISREERTFLKDLQSNTEYCDRINLVGAYRSPLNLLALLLDIGRKY